MNQAKSPAEFQITGAKTYVKILYRVRVQNGPVLKGAAEPETMDFVTGYRQVIPGLEKRLIGRGRGERLEFTVPPEEAFGARHKELVIEKPKSDFHFPRGMEPYPGMALPFVSPIEGAPETVMVREVKPDTIVIDCNHPLSGAALQYELEIVEARPATDKDLCSEWEQQSESVLCGCGPHEIVLGSQEGDEPARC